VKLPSLFPAFALLVQTASAGVRLEPLAKLEGSADTTTIVNLLFSPDGKTVITGDFSGAIWSWDVARGKEKKLAQFAKAEIWDLDLSPDGKELAVAAVGDASSQLARFDVLTGKVSGSITMREVILGSVRYHPAGKVLATDNTDNKGSGVRFWNRADWPVKEGVEQKRVKGIDVPMKDRAGQNVEVSYMEFTPDRKLLVTASDEPRLRIWSLPDGKPFGRLDNPGTTPLTTIAVSSQGKGVVVACGQHDMVVWEIATKKLLGHHRAGDGEGKWSARAAGISPDGIHIVSSFYKGKPDPEDDNHGTGLLIWNVPLGGAPVFELDDAHSGADINLVRFSPGGKMVATAAGDGSIRLWKIVVSE